MKEWRIDENGDRILHTQREGSFLQKLFGTADQSEEDVDVHDSPAESSTGRIPCAQQAISQLSKSSKETTVEERKQQVQERLEKLEAQREAERNPTCDFNLDLGLFAELQSEAADLEEEMRMMQAPIATIAHFTGR